MKKFIEYIQYISDLKRKHDISSRRYYNRDSEAVILKLITQELSRLINVNQ